MMAKIVIVDDHPVNRELLVTLLGYQGHELFQAADGGEGLKLVKEVRPDLVITDILMPSMDGFEFVRRLRADPVFAQTPVIFCSADFHGPEERQLARNCGVNHLLVKPCEPELVLQTVEEALHGRLTSLPSQPPPDFDREHLRLVTDKLSQKSEELETANRRLTALIEINLRLVAEHDPERLLNQVCHSARDLMGAKYAAVGVRGSLAEDTDYFVTSGIDAAAHGGPDTLVLRQGMLGSVLTEGRPRRFRNPEGHADAVGLPATYPATHYFLGAPIKSVTQTYGWICLGDKLAEAEFTEEDERLLAILASQVGRIYEKRSLYRQVESHAQDLEREVAQRQKAEEELSRVNQDLERRVAERTEQLEAANKELEAFSHSVSHDLRAPLRHVIGFVSLALDKSAAQLPPETLRDLQAAMDAAGRMDQLISDLLDFSRTAQVGLHRGPVDFNVLIQEVLKTFQPDLQDREIEWRIDSFPQMRGDRVLLRQVMLNLVSNAIKFTRKLSSARIEIGCRREQDETVTFVRDNGAGFDMHYADRLFGVFQRLHSLKQFEGTGIGLANVQRIIRRHGGRVWAQGRVGEGATFSFALPAVGE